MTWIVFHESSNKTDALSPNGKWAGLLQIDWRLHGYTLEQCFDPDFNIEAGHKLWQQGGVKPWPVTGASYPGKAAAMDFPPDETAPVLPRLVASRPAGCVPKLVIVHATRGATTQAMQYTATKNWFNNPSNPGGCATVVISHEGQLCRFMDELRQIPQWSAGYGGGAGWACDHWGLSMELAQSDKQEPFDPRTIDRAALVAAEWCKKYAIAPTHLGNITQGGQAPPFTGIVGHDETENGRRLGKSDPGAAFPWPAFITKVNAYLNGGTPPTPEDDDVFTVQSYPTLTGEVAPDTYVFDLARLGIPSGVKRARLQIWPRQTGQIPPDAVLLVDPPAAPWLYVWHGLPDVNNREAGQCVAPVQIVEVIPTGDNKCYVGYPGAVFDIQALGYYT